MSWQSPEQGTKGEALPWSNQSSFPQLPLPVQLLLRECCNSGLSRDPAFNGESGGAVHEQGTQDAAGAAARGWCSRFAQHFWVLLPALPGASSSIFRSELLLGKADARSGRAMLLT